MKQIENTGFIDNFLKEKNFTISLKISSKYEIFNFHNISSVKKEENGTLLLNILNHKSKLNDIFEKLLNDIINLNYYDYNELLYCINQNLDDLTILGECFQFFLTENFKNILYDFDSQKESKSNSIVRIKNSELYKRYNNENNNDLIKHINTLQKSLTNFSFDKLVCIYRKYIKNIKDSINSIDFYLISKHNYSFKESKEIFKYTITVPRMKYIIDKNDSYTEFEITNFCDLINSYIYYFLESNSNKTKLKICKNCNQYFVTNKRSDIQYCSNISPNNKKKTCQEIGSKLFWKESLKNDKIKKQHVRIGNRYRKIIQNCIKNNDLKRDRKK